ncbi:hypothetical protein K438DRAFT_1962306 [Mycena galopus ATCC 62051]|nr:hypothetical protein K438DRAFT_1962306 [Mycena galopus ATCC 62051]
MPNKGFVTDIHDAAVHPLEEAQATASRSYERLGRSSHLLGLILGFHPGTTILIPSAAIFHSNIPIAVGERWFQTEEEFLATLTDSQVGEEHLGLKRAATGVALFSTLDELKAEA